MTVRIVNNYIMSFLYKTYRHVFGKFFKTTVIIGNAACADKSYFHKK